MLNPFMNSVHEVQDGADFISLLSIEIDQELTLGTFADEIKVQKILKGHLANSPEIGLVVIFCSHELQPHAVVSDRLFP